MWGDKDISIEDAAQGLAGDCYIIAAMSSLAEFPELVKDVFLVDSLNPQGIYAFKFYIRGKPWVVTIDDTFLK